MSNWRWHWWLGSTLWTALFVKCRLRCACLLRKESAAAGCSILCKWHLNNCSRDTSISYDADCLLPRKALLHARREHVYKDPNPQGKDDFSAPFAFRKSFAHFACRILPWQVETLCGRHGKCDYGRQRSAAPDLCLALNLQMLPWLNEIPGHECSDVVSHPWTRQAFVSFFNIGACRNPSWQCKNVLGSMCTSTEKVRYQMRLSWFFLCMVNDKRTPKTASRFFTSAFVCSGFVSLFPTGEKPWNCGVDVWPQSALYVQLGLLKVCEGHLIVDCSLCDDVLFKTSWFRKKWLLRQAGEQIRAKMVLMTGMISGHMTYEVLNTQRWQLQKGTQPNTRPLLSRIMDR